MAHIKDLTFDPRNARKHNPRNIGMIAESLQRYGPARSIAIDEDSTILAGNGVVEAAMQIGVEHVRVYDRATGQLDPEPPNGEPYIFAVRVSGMTSDEKKLYSIADNRTSDLSEFDPAVIDAFIGEGLDVDQFFFEEELARVRAATDELFDYVQPDPGEPVAEGAEPRQTLADRFIVPPFSVLDARQGYWQARKRAWLELGIQSEIGRGENTLGFSTECEDYRTADGEYSKTQATPGGSTGNGPGRTFGQDLMRGEHIVGAKMSNPQNDVLGGGGFSNQLANRTSGRGASSPPTGDYEYPVEQLQQAPGTSIFDPVLCELAYRWFSPPVRYRPGPVCRRFGARHHGPQARAALYRR